MDVEDFYVEMPGNVTDARFRETTRSLVRRHNNLVDYVNELEKRLEHTANRLQSTLEVNDLWDGS